VGAGTDFVQWVRAGANATGVDLTEQGVALTRERLDLEGRQANVNTADAERLPFEDESFDIVYSWGVLHHSPDTRQAISEVHRVLRPGGTALVMIYHLRSWVALNVWALHAAARGRPWKSPRWAVYNHLESPGTKAYTTREARELFSQFGQVQVSTCLSHGDYLRMRPSARYGGAIHRLLFRIYPRWLVRALGDGFGMNLLISARKSG
jgi:ubiquinone/menaquinone biosynthesis C-methylase UbiE